jgi:hypothetical protein
MITFVCFFFRFEYRRKHFVVATVAAVVLVALVALGIGIGYRSSKQVKVLKHIKVVKGIIRLIKHIKPIKHIIQVK